MQWIRNLFKPKYDAAARMIEVENMLDAYTERARRAAEIAEEYTIVEEEAEYIPEEIIETEETRQAREMEETYENIQYETGETTEQFFRQLIDFVNDLQKRVHELETETTTLKERLDVFEYYNEGTGDSSRPTSNSGSIHSRERAV